MTFNSYVIRIRRSFESRPFRSIIIALLALLAVLAIFEAGVLFGLHQARHSYSWGESYERNFGGPAGGFFPRPGSTPNGHGAFGRIASTTSSSFIITDPSHPEQSVRIDGDTVIRNGNQTVTASTLSAGTYVIVIGMPGADGVIDAKLIRVIPAPPTDTASSTFSTK